jgi:phosphatidyl-myo-inositol alpha-mannosyltransferase
VRIALLCPYSWTYPGGVTRHIEALARELIAAGEEVSVLAPFDPDDTLSRRLHRGARPEPRRAPEHLVPLGRTLGIEANGAVSNLSLFPEAVARMRAELRNGGYDVVHVHEPVVPILAWDALCSTNGVPLVGTFHTYSDNAVSNGAARLAGAARRMNRLHARIAVSEAAAWTATRFFGGRYRVVPNGVHLPPGAVESAASGEGPAGVAGVPLDGAALSGGAFATPARGARPLRILFIGQAVERKGLPVLLKAFEALREHVPATLTLVGADRGQVAPLLLDDRGVSALGKVSEAQKEAALAEADVLCAPSLRGESFGMILTEAFAASTPVIASDITGYRDVMRDGLDGRLVPPGDPVALAEALRDLALDPRRREQMALAARQRAERFAWPRVASEVLDVYEEAISVAAPASRPQRLGLRLGLAPSDLLPKVAPQRLGSLEATPRRAPARRAIGVCVRLALVAAAITVVVLALTALDRVGLGKVLASLVSSQPGLVAAGLGLMCAAMVLRGLAWHALLRAVPTTRRARRRDALQGTFIGVLMSATLPVRLGETSRALVVARRLGRVRETLPLVLPTIVSQTLLNALALAVLGVGSVASVDLPRGDGVLLALTPAAALLVVLLGPALIARAPAGEAGGRMQRLRDAIGLVLRRVREGLSLLAHPREAALATLAQLSAWGLQVLACWLLLMALGLDMRTGFGAAPAVLFAVNVTAFVPLTPANVGVFQAACVAVLTGAYHVSGPDALAYGIILQAVELAAATSMGLPALMSEGLSWRELRLRTIHAAPVRLGPLPAPAAREAADAGFSS